MQSTGYYVVEEREEEVEDLETWWKAMPYRRQWGRAAKDRRFKRRKESKWRELVTKQKIPGGFESMPKRVREGWTEKHERSFLQIAHDEVMTQERAAAYTRVKPYKKWTNKMKEEQWRKELRRALAEWPELSMKCPLCEKKEDGLTHTLMC